MNRRHFLKSAGIALALASTSFAATKSIATEPRILYSLDRLYFRNLGDSIGYGLVSRNGRILHKCAVPAGGEYTWIAYPGNELIGYNEELRISTIGQYMAFEAPWRKVEVEW